MNTSPHSPLCMCQTCQDEAASELHKDAETLLTVTAERDDLLTQLEKYKTALAGQDRNLLRQEKVFGESRRKLEVERVALRAMIEDAPTLAVIEHAHLVAGEQITGIHDEKTFPYLAGKRIALVRLDNE